jgi:signal transduction histidine kinase
MKRSKPTTSGPRADTDESLRGERSKSDREVERRDGRAESVADAVVQQARDDADEVLRAARAADSSPPGPGQTEARGEADAATRRRRTAADVKLEEERRERTRALAALFALERELTDRHLLAERLGADVALRNRDDFLGIVAHDLRGLMGEIALHAAVLVRSAAPDEAGQRTARTGQAIQRATARMSRLVGDLLDVAAIDAGRLGVDAAPADLAGAQRDAAEPFRAAAEGKGIALVLEEAPPTVTARFDHDRVIQVLGNLVANAIKFTPPGGRIALRLTEADGQARLAVADTGAGMEPGRVEQAFQRFAQLQPDRRGLGLGLYISRCLVEAQGGRLTATSAPGQGSTFTLTLPLAG